MPQKPTAQNYIAKELTHFTTYERLCKILNDCVLLGGPNIEDSKKGVVSLSIYYKADISQDEMIDVNKVCFSDIPEGQTEIHRAKFGDCGIAFDKDFIIGKGGIPVHYVPNDAIVDLMSANGEKGESFFNRMTKELYEHFDSLICESAQDPDFVKKDKYRRLYNFVVRHIYVYYIFFDHTLPDKDPDNYYFEREWRVVGSVKFRLSDIRNVILPQEDVAKFGKDCPNYKGPVNGSST